MNELQLRFELQGSLQQWVDSTMQQYNISAAMMEDAMSKILLSLKDKVWQDYLLEQQKAYEEMLASSTQTLEGEDNGNKILE
jgi:hypothetical protein